MPKEEYTAKVALSSAAEGQVLFGPGDRFLHIVEQEANVKILTRDESIVIQGEREPVEQIVHLYEVLIQLIQRSYPLTERDIVYAVDLAKQRKANQLLDLFQGEITTTQRGKPIRVKTIGQKQYVSEIRNKDVVFGIGPAGTGKTYLAVVLAVAALKKGEVKRIILTRPAVEAGENLGFLPGDLQEKVDPYLRPLYDALHDVLGAEQVLKHIERGIIEVAPLAYMRGRTLDDSFIILDEAQNTTFEQMKMFLTRLGFGSKMVVTGDITQIDLPTGKKSGLIEASRILREIKDIGFTFFSEHDVVRHSLVQRIIVAYEKYQEQANR